MTPRDTQRRPLTELQQAILDRLWSRGPATADQIREALLPAHRLKDSSVRTLLRRLEARGFVKAEWGTSDNNRRARYYELTAAGRKQLAAERDAWERFATALGLILDAG